jgi:hypothetical protein
MPHLPTPKKHKANSVQHIICLNDVTSTGTDLPLLYLRQTESAAQIVAMFSWPYHQMTLAHSKMCQCTSRVPTVWKPQIQINTKDQGKAVLCLTQYHTIETYRMLNQAPCHKGVWVNGGIAPRIFNLGARWRWIVSFTPLLLNSWDESLWYPLNWWLGSPQSQSGHCGEEEKVFAAAGNQTPGFQPVA